ncbi:MAG: MXAN_2562 family outer membrane beta-barrel protein, partial [Deltaproteobacteria bacterium]
FNSALGVEAGGGYMTKNGKGRTVTGIATGAETTFQMAPVDMTLLYRLNLFPDQIIVPYIGGGLSYNLYWEKVKDGKELKGGMWGHHATGGLQILLDRFDKSSARNFKEDYGIENTYLTIGATHSVIDDFGGETVNLGGWNYQAGLLFEF